MRTTGTTHQRLRLLGSLTLVVIAAAAVSVATRAWYWAVAAEALIAVAFCLGMNKSRGG